MRRIFTHSLLLLALGSSSSALAQQSQAAQPVTTPVPSTGAGTTATQPQVTPPAAASGTTNTQAAPGATTTAPGTKVPEVNAASPPATPPASTGTGDQNTAAPATGNDGTSAQPDSNGDTVDAPPPPGGEDEDFSLGDIPIVDTVELTDEKARKALDVYVQVKEKYKDSDIESFENLQDFVDQAQDGKAFEADVKGAGFTDVAEWNNTVTTISFAYANVVDDQTAEIKQQIEELQKDTETAQDMRDRMIKALNAMIPSDNNRKVIESLVKDPVYSDKLKQLGSEEE